MDRCRFDICMERAKSLIEKRVKDNQMSTEIMIPLDFAQGLIGEYEWLRGRLSVLHMLTEFDVDKWEKVKGLDKE